MWESLIWLIGLLICVFLGDYLVKLIVKNFRTELPGPLALQLGFIEILSYAVSYIMGFPVFIIVWLALKTANRWKANMEQPHVNNSFLIGNLLSMIIGVYLGVIFRSYLIDMGLLDVFKGYFLL